MRPFSILFFLIVIIAVFVGGVFFLYSKQSQYITNYPPSGNTIIAFGDSLTVGVGSSSGKDFVSLLSRKLNTPIVNLGKSGDTTEDALLRIPEVLEYNPRIVIVLLGGNDVLRKIPQEKTLGNLRTIINEFQKGGAVIMLLGIRGGILRDNNKKEFMRLANDTGSLYVPNVLGGIIGNSKLMYDTIHPNDSGYAIIADRVFEVLVPYVN